MKENEDPLKFMRQDHLSGTFLVTNADGSVSGDINYYPFGGTRVGDGPVFKILKGEHFCFPHFFLSVTGFAG